MPFIYKFSSNRVYSAILSRQFMDMSRSRIEGLLASFPKLIDNNEQHTFVETDSVRYVYQPLEELFMVLITNKNSNILQDIETLNLFVRAISDYCHNINTHEIEEMAFELSSVFDEIVNLGYREYVSIQQLRTISEMESHEEKLAAEIEKVILFYIKKTIIIIIIIIKKKKILLNKKKY